jgi:isopentenyl diphosphate isomerase/L-lactate dehydrogenase-like FMN-dependent dehydrogenase
MNHMTLLNCPTIDDLRVLARKRVPTLPFDFVDGGAGDDGGVRRNRQALDNILLLPRYMAGVTVPGLSLNMSLFGHVYNFPIGIAPTGLANMAWPGADMILAGLARKMNIPIVVSTMASTSLEEMAACAEDNTWFQLYTLTDAKANFDLLDRAWAAGIRVLALTVDVPIVTPRHRDIRNGFGRVPLRVTPKLIWDFACHPRWLAGQLLGSKVQMANLVPYCGEGMSNTVLAKVVALTKFDVSLSDIERIRDYWKGKLVIKGILNPDDITRVKQLGADGIWVSNHGGRQLESAPASIDCLASCAEVAGTNLTVLFDSGVRSGEDIVKARCMGADACFTGRTLLYGVMAAGEAGAYKAFDIVKDGLQKILVQIGARSAVELDRNWLG